MNLQKLFLTFFGVGDTPKHPKLLSMILAILLGIVLLRTMGIETLSILALAGAIIAVFEINKYKNSTQEEEEYSVVIDKVVGIWITLMIVQPTALTLPYEYIELIFALLSLGSFWLLDRWKPSTIGWIYHNVKGGLGIIGATVLTGFAAGFLSIIVLKIIQSLLG